MLPRTVSLEIDGLRGLATLGVIWGHSIYSLNMPVELNGAFWVWIFFSLSGFFVGDAYVCGRYELSANGYLSYIWNRALRILPLYYTALCLGLLFEILGSARKISVPGVIKQFLFVSPLNSTTLAGPLWALATIMQFYAFSIVLVYVIAKAREERRLVLSLVILFLSIAASAILVDAVGDNFAQPRTLVGNLHYFAWGLVLAFIRWDRLPQIKQYFKYSAIATLVGVAWYLNNYKPTYFWGLGDRFSNYISLGGGSLCSMLIVFVAMLREPQQSTGKLIQIAVWCGFYSYGIYVWHSIFAKADQVFIHIKPGLICLLFLASSIIPAFFSYRIIEAPLQLLRKGKTASHYSAEKTNLKHST